MYHYIIVQMRLRSTDNILPWYKQVLLILDLLYLVLNAEFIGNIWKFLNVK